VKTNEGTVYPQQALAERLFETIDVPLVLTIDANGSVASAVLDKSVGHGFDEAALAAAQKLVFLPATRDGKPVASRTRFVYRFTPPLAVLSGRVLTLSHDHPIADADVVVRDASGGERRVTTGSDGSWRIEGLPAGVYHLTVSAPAMTSHEADETLDPGQEATATDRLELAGASPTGGGAARNGTGENNEVEEVEVRGRKLPREVTKRTLERREIDRIPGTNGDALRSLQNLPGVGRPPALAGLLIVRGSAPQDTQYFVDGTPVPLVYHFGGLSSVVPTEMLDRIDFYPGNFSAQYGRAMGGIVDVGLTDPKKDKLHGFVQLDLIDARALAQGPLFDTGWTFAVAGRRSWFDLWLGPVLTAAGAGVSVAPVYYDYQALLQRDLGKRSSIRFAFFGTDDRLAILLNGGSNPTLTGGLGFHSGFWRAQALYRNRFNDDTELRVVASTGEDYFQFNVGDLAFSVTDWPITSRVELAQKIEKRLTMNVGVDMFYEPYTISIQAPPLPVPGQPPPGPFNTRPTLREDSSNALYMPAFYTEWEATPWAGARIIPGIRLDYTKDTKSWDLAPRFVVRQDVTRAPRTTLKMGAGLFAQPPLPQETNAKFGTPGLSDNRAYHYDVGIEREFTNYIEASLEGFYKQLDNLVTQSVGNVGTGVIYGAEALIRYKPDERFFGWLAYTLSRSERRDAPGMPLHLTQYDETHILTVLGSYRLGGGWEFGLRYRLTSGYMDTPRKYGYFDENAGTYLPLLSQPPFGSRLPLFHSLDLRVDKTWQLSWGTIAAYLDVLNVYNNANVAGISYDYNSTHSTYASDLPILPSIGLRAEM
jgi:TonB family protein